MEYQSLIANLKENKEQLTEEIRDLQYQLEKSRKELGIMKQRMHVLEQQVASSRGYDLASNQKRIQELESEIAFLQQQVIQVLLATCTCTYIHVYMTMYIIICAVLILCHYKILDISRNLRGCVGQ